MKKESKGLIIGVLLMITIFVFMSAFTGWVYADPDTENPIVPIEPDNPSPQPQPQPTPQPEQPEIRPPVNQNTENNNQTIEENNEEKTDTRLISLSIDCGNLNPEFSSDIYSYTVYVNPEADNRSCIIYAEAIEPDNTKVTVKGPKEFGKKNTKKTVIIEAEDGSKSEYVINVHVLKDNEVFIGGKLLQTINSEVIDDVSAILGKRFGLGNLLLKYVLYMGVVFAAATLVVIAFKLIKNKNVASSSNFAESREVMLDYVIVVFLNYINSVNVKKNFRPPSYFINELKIGDINSFIRKLEKKNYIELDDNDICNLTLKGKKFLNEHLDYIEFFNLAAEGISIVEYHEGSKRELDEGSFEKTMLRLIIKKLKKLNIEEDFDLAGKMHYTAGKLYQKLNLKEQALYHYLCTLYLCVSGEKYRNIVSEYGTRRHSKEYVLYTYNDIYISPYLVSDIKELSKVYEEELADYVYEENKLNFNLCSLEMYKTIIKEITMGEFVSEKWQEELRIVYERMLDD